MNGIIKNIKKIYSKEICLFKMGAFYHTYGRDSYIMSYLFGYKIKEIEMGYKECGFPKSAIAKVTSKLENSSINYMIIDRRNSYEVDDKVEYKNLNKYDKFYEKAKNYINHKKRIDNINTFLMESIEQEYLTKMLGRMEDIIYEGRKV